MSIEKPLEKHPFLKTYTHPVKKAERAIIGRENEMNSILAAFQRPELCNVILLGEAGSGKTALVQGTMLHDKKRLYLEVDLSKMIADLTDNNQMADRLKQLFNEVMECVREDGREIVLFMDEFHQVVQLSAAAVEALKPLLADSGTRGIRVIAATTYEEFRKYISPNQPLVERLQRISLQQPGEDLTVSILKGMAKRYGVDNQFYNDNVFKLIYEYTNRYVPASSQPRKSILVLDSMVGWHRLTGHKMDAKLLADVIYETTGTNVAFRVDATSIKKDLDKHVLAQKFATDAIEQRLQICVADLNDKTKPMSTMLFTGSTGVGKGLINETLIPVYTPDGSVVTKRNGDLQIGDYVFNRHGEPVRVVGVFPRGKQDVYEVKLTDGRSLITDSSHLWTYMLSKGKYSANTYTNSTKELFDRGVYTESHGRHCLKYWIPMNEAVQYPEAKLSVHPYVMGSFIGNGCCTIHALTLSSNDEDNVRRIAELLPECSHYTTTRSRNFNWMFGAASGPYKWLRIQDVFADYPDMIGCKAPDKKIPEPYMTASVEQRWELVRGLFDTDGSIGSKDGGCYNITYSTTSHTLALQIQRLLFSLGVASSVTIARHIKRDDIGNYTQYAVHAKVAPKDKPKFFWLPRKKQIAETAAKQPMRLSRRKDFSWVGITDIVKLDEQKETTCIYVDDEEHLYQAGDFVVTHNTEMAKQLARILFDDDRNLIRFDMTEYANDDSLERFREQLTSRVWERPYSIILLDEIEKASAAVTRLLLQVIDDGRLSDQNGRETPFINSYIILTTNAGSEIYRTIAQYNADDEGSGKIMKKYDALIRRSLSSTTGDNRFPPELLGRIDVIIPFQPLSRETQKAIVKMKLQKLKKEIMAKHGATLRVSARVIDYLVEDNLSTDSDSGGARRVMSKLESELTTAVARYINSHPDISVITVDVEGQMAFENKDQLESEAYIMVGGR